jgi:hypothetical protein
MIFAGPLPGSWAEKKRRWNPAANRSLTVLSLLTGSRTSIPMPDLGVFEQHGLYTGFNLPAVPVVMELMIELSQPSLGRGRNMQHFTFV